MKKLNMDKKSKVRTIIGKIIDVPILLLDLSAIFSFIVITFYSLKYWQTIFFQLVTLESKFFWVGLIISILASAMYFLEIFIKDFAKSFKHLISKNKNE